MEESADLEFTGIRMDRYLWHVRLCKTRSLATQACQSGDVRIENERIKPSRLVKSGMEFQIRRAGADRTYRILKLVDHRISAKEVESLVVETTPPEVLEMLEAARQAPVPKRDPGMGRPTKRDLRLIEKLFS